MSRKIQGAHEIDRTRWCNERGPNRPNGGPWGVFHKAKKILRKC